MLSSFTKPLVIGQKFTPSGSKNSGTPEFFSSQLALREKKLSKKKQSDNLRTFHIYPAPSSSSRQIIE